MKNRKKNRKSSLTRTKMSTNWNLFNAFAILRTFVCVFFCLQKKKLQKANTMKLKKKCIYLCFSTQIHFQAGKSFLPEELLGHRKHKMFLFTHAHMIMMGLWPLPCMPHIQQKLHQHHHHQHDEKFKFPIFTYSRWIRMLNTKASRGVVSLAHLVCLYCFELFLLCFFLHFYIQTN